MSSFYWDFQPPTGGFLLFFKEGVEGHNISLG